MDNHHTSDLISVFQAVAESSELPFDVALMLNALSDGDDTIRKKSRTLGIAPTLYFQFAQRSLSAFQDHTGMPLYDAIRSDGRMTKGFGLDGYDPDCIFLDQQPTLQRIVSIADACLSPREFYAVISMDLYKAAEKRSVQGSGHDFGFSKRVMEQAYRTGKTKLAQAISDQAPELADHPFLRKRAFIKERGKTYPINMKNINMSDAATARLFMISSTLFSPLHHSVFCHRYLFDSGKPQNKRSIAKKHGMTLEGYRGLHEGLKSTLKSALRFEDGGDKLSQRLDDIGASLSFKRHTHSKNKALIDGVDESKIDLDDPIILLIYKIALNVGLGSEAHIFTMNTLYRAENKMTAAEIKEAFGYSLRTIGTASGIIPKIKDVLKEQGYGVICNHPTLRQKRMPLEGDRAAKDQMQADDFSALYRHLNDEQRTMWDMASNVTKPKQFYCFVRGFLVVPAETKTKIAKDLGIERSHVGRFINSARALIDDTLDIRKALNDDYPPLTSAMPNASNLQVG